MTTALPSARRRSRFIFDWSAANCIARGALDAITGQVATYSRNSFGTSFDENGAVKYAAYAQSRFQWWLNPVTGVMEPGALLEGNSATNYCGFSEDFASWDAGGGAAAASNNLIAPNGTLTGDTVRRTVNAGDNLIFVATWTNNGTKCASVFIKQGTSPKSQFSLYDRTTGTHKGAVSVTWAAGVPVVANAANALIIFAPVLRANGWWRIAWTTNSFIDTTHANWIVVYPGDAFGGTGAVGDNIGVWGFQAEDGTAPSSYIPTPTASTVGRAPDSLAWPLNLPPCDMTIYADVVNLNATSFATNWGMWSIGGGAVPYFLGRIDGASSIYTSQLGSAGPVYSDADTGGGVVIGYGDRAEGRSVLIKSGTQVTSGLTKNVGTETTAGPSTGATVGSAWSSAILRAVSDNAGQPGNHLLRALRIGVGSQSLAYMRGAWS